MNFDESQLLTRPTKFQYNRTKGGELASFDRGTTRSGRTDFLDGGMVRRMAKAGSRKEKRMKRNARARKNGVVQVVKRPQ